MLVKEERIITVDGQVHTVVISDEHEALLAADAAGRAVIGLWDPNRPEQNLSPALFLAERAEDVDEEYAERVLRRKLKLPWMIGETKRLLIREFCLADVPQVPEEQTDTEADRVFASQEKLKGYIRCQYGFHQYGIWALVRKSDGKLIGKAGVTDLEHGEFPSVELGYHIFEAYRGQGYGTEACREILNYVKSHINYPVYAEIDASNEASIRLATSCGFRIIQQIYSGEGQDCCLYLWSC